MDVLKYADINPDDAKHLAQRLHRKKDDLNLVRKFITVDKVEAVDEERSIVARVSTNDRDRDGEVVEPKGIDLSGYIKNPCLLWAHHYDQPAIGKALWSKTDDKGLVCKFQFAPTQFADEIYQLYKGGYQRAFSIGFIPMDFDSVEKVHRKVSLLEVSAVPVPANQDALVLEAYQKGMIKSIQLAEDLNIPHESTRASSPEPPATTGMVSHPVGLTDKESITTYSDPNWTTAPIAIADADILPPFIITKPETTENYHRIPVSTGHEGHEMRTITVSAKDGIKALYCIPSKEIITYLFSTDKWTMEEAKRWVEEHKKDLSDLMAEPYMADYPESQDMDYSVIYLGNESAHVIRFINISAQYKTKLIAEQPPDLASELASLRQDVAAILARLQVTPEPAVQASQPLPAPSPIAPEEITIDAEPEIEVEDDAQAPEKSAEELVEAYIKSGDFDKAVAEAVKVAIAKLRGRVI